jgi:DNA-directed RNA polymerase specialized sigma24 family protein
MRSNAFPAEAARIRARHKKPLPTFRIGFAQTIEGMDALRTGPAVMASSGVKMAKPLMKHVGKTGRPYERPPKIEAEIDQALGEVPADLRPRLAITKRNVPGYLSSECMVHLFRAARRRGDQLVVNEIARLLLKRIEANLRVRVSESAHYRAEDARERVLGAFAELLALDHSTEDTHQLDFYECRYNQALAMLRIDCIRHETALVGPVGPLPSARTDDEGSADGADDIEEGPDVPCAERLVLYKQLWEAIDRLEPDERRALVLVHLQDVPVESTDPTKFSAASICGVSAPTIRARIARAQRKLKAYFQEEK